MSQTSILTEKDFQTKYDIDKIRNLIEDIIGKAKKYTFTISENNNESFHFDPLLFLEICVENEDSISAVFKIMNKGSVKSKFKNELFMYKSFIQTRSKDFQSLFPSVTYTSPVSDSDNMVIALEDLTKNGFRMPLGRVKMDIEEIRISLKALGKFHAEMYTVKLSEPKLFSELTNFVKSNNTNFVQNNDPRSLYMQSFVKTSVLRTLNKCLIKNNEINNKIETLYNLLQNNGIKELCLKSLEPEEPIAVICHGDYNRHNLMFRYENGVPVDCKIIDLQTPSYGSPTLDIGFILFMNTESSDRVKHWTSLWRDYYDALQERLRINMGANFEIPSFLSVESLQNDFRRKCFFPIINSIFFTCLNFCEMSRIFKLIGEVFEIDESEEESRVKLMQQFLKEVETEDVVRINTELLLEYVENYENYYLETI